MRSQSRGPLTDVTDVRSMLSSLVKSGLVYISLPRAAMRGHAVIMKEGRASYFGCFRWSVDNGKFDQDLYIRSASLREIFFKLIAIHLCKVRSSSVIR